MSNQSTASGVTWQGYHFSPQELEILRSLVLERLGIAINAEKDYLLVSRFGKMLKFNNLKNATELIGFLRSMPENADKALASFLTTGHTYFFRESSHFGLLTMLLRKSAIASPTVWCAATSTGEEIYSIAIALFEAGYQDFTLIGSDINYDALKACRIGTYVKQRLANVEPLFLSKYFKAVPGGGQTSYQILDPIRERIVLKRLNLLDSIAFERKFDAIFCRNVLIYFNEDTQKKVLGNITQNLAPRGYLFLGHSEPIIGNAIGLATVAPAVYQNQL